MRAISRRQILLAGAASLLVPSRTSFANVKSASAICVFTKPFNSLSFEELADRIAELGVDGIEAPIRKGGHIEPVDVEEKLPKLVEALRQRNLEITVLTSDVNDPSDPLSVKVLKTAASVGIKRYRLKYFKYKSDRPIMKQLNEWKPQLRELAALNGEVGIRGIYQNHAGNGYMGASLWDLRHLLRNIPKQDLAVAYDIRHATVEGGMSWPTTFQMIRPYVDTVYVKDFVWDAKKTRNVPLGQGYVKPIFFQMLAESGFDGPISLHEEYLDHREPSLVPQHLDAIRNDLATLGRWLKS